MSTPLRMWPCTVCQSVSTQESGRRRTTSHPCPVCGKTYVNEGSLRKHIAGHPEASGMSTPLRMWPCTVCQSVSTQESGRRRTTSHPCPVCGKTYVNEGSLRKHIAGHPEASGMSTPLRMWPCTVCQSVFTQESGRRRTTSHPCPVCGKTYVNEGSLRKHIAGHPEASGMSTPLRMWPCTVCQSVFTQESDKTLLMAEDASGTKTQTEGGKTTDDATSKEKDKVSKPKKTKVRLMELSIVLDRLTEAEILKYTEAPFPPHNFRDLSAQKSSFSKYKRKRNEYLKRRRRKHREPRAEKSSVSEVFEPKQQDEESSKKKKRLGYEEDVDWSPPEELVPVVERPVRSNLRINPRRKRIESASSDSGQEERVYPTRHRTDKKDPLFLGESSGDESFFKFFAEAECDMEAEPELTDQESIQQLVAEIIDCVSNLDDDGKVELQKCRWCDSVFDDPQSALCPICKDMGMGETLNMKKPNSKARKGRPRLKGNNSMVKKLQKMLPKQEMQKILFNSKRINQEKKFNHIRTKETPKCQDPPVPVDAFTEALNVKSEGGKKRKRRLKIKGNPYEESSSKVDNKAQEIATEVKKRAVQALKEVSAKGEQQKMSLTGVDKGLFLMTFPDPQHGLELNDNSKTVASQPANVQHGTYLLPTVPSVVVANYATADADKGDYFLSSLYYQNEPSQKTTSTATTSIVSSPAVSAGTVSVIKMNNVAPVAKQRTAPSVGSFNRQLKITPVPRTSNFTPVTSLPVTHCVPIAPKLQVTASSTSSNQRVQMGMPSLSELVNGSHSSVTLTPANSISTPVLPQTQFSAAISSLNSHLQNVPRTFSSIMGVSSTPSVMQTQMPLLPVSEMVKISPSVQITPISIPQTSFPVMPVSSTQSLRQTQMSLLPSNEMVKINQNLLISPISNPPAPVNAISCMPEPQASSELEDDLVDIKPTLIGGRVIDAPSLVPPEMNNKVENSSLSTSGLPLIPDNSLQITPISTLPFSSDIPLVPVEIAKITEPPGSLDNPCNTFLMENTGLRDQLEGFNQYTGSTTPMDDSHHAMEKSAEKHDSEGTSLLNLDCPIPDISAILDSSLKETATLREKTIQELDAICILCITDFEEDPKTALLRFIESNRENCEALMQKNGEAKPNDLKPEDIQSKLASLQRDAGAMDIAWQYLRYHSSFLKYSDTLLKTCQLLNVQIKKELVEQEEVSSCRFSGQSQAVSQQLGSNHQLPSQEFSGQSASGQLQQLASSQLLTSQDSLSNIICQIQNTVDSISNLPPAATHYHGLSPMTVVTSDPSRETPSRGSGPRTPARPESALSQPEEFLQDPYAQNGRYVQQQTAAVQQQRYTIQQQAVRVSNQMGLQAGQYPVQRFIVQSGPEMNTLTQVSSQGTRGKVFNVIQRVDPGRRQPPPSYVVQSNQVPVSQNNYVRPVSYQNFTTGSTVVLQTGQPQVLPQQRQNNFLPPTEDVSLLRCAVCYGVATLRCKQCSKVAYCNTQCAKKYWHLRHKVECLQLMNT